MQLLLIIGYVWPEPTATAAGSRMLQIIAQFKKLGYKIIFACAAQKPEKAFNLSCIDVEEENIKLNDASFDDFIKKINPQIVLFDRFMIEEQFGWRVAEVCPEALRVLDSEDLHFLRKARQEAVRQNKSLPTGIIHSDEAKREIASIYRCDVTLTISEFEMEYLKKIYRIPKNLLWYFPFLVDVDNLHKPSFKDRQDFIFVGNFIHNPNWDAVLQLKQKIWPLLKKQLPHAKLHVYGGYPSEKVYQLHNQKDRFLVQGRAKDINVVMQNAKVCLAPLRFGAGLKGKLIDAMQNNTPFVTTEIGAEGMFGDADANNCVANNINDFVEKAVKLYVDEQAWCTESNKGKIVLKNRFDKTTFSKGFEIKLAEVLLKKHEHRNQNFMGSMLQHHTLKSSMYLSKWITEKNKTQNL